MWITAFGLDKGAPTSANIAVASFGRMRGLRPNRPVGGRSLGARFQSGL